jgi:hypothetical protein
LKNNKEKKIMKKLTRKLLLSSFALALALVTLTTTTFAWYTTNREVSATVAQSTTKGDVSGSLEISTDNSSWGPTAAVITSVDGLVPLQYISGELYTKDDIENAATAGTYLQFTVYVRTSSTLTTDTTVYLKNLTITNQTADLATTSKSVLSTTGMAEGTTVGSKYTVDVVRALSLAISSTASTIGSTEYSYGEIATPVEDTFTGKTGNALLYYDAVMGGTLTDSRTAATALKSTGSAIEVATIEGADAVSSTASAGVPVVFTVWLDGWDLYCFDACQGQSFDIAFELTTNAGDVVVKA